MKRDMETIREILLKEEADAKTSGFHKYVDPMEVHQILLMIDAGLLQAEIVKVGAKPVAAMIYRLTWAGHEFLDTLRDPTIWQLAKTKVLKPGASWTFSILMEFAKAEAVKRLGGLVP